MIDMEDYYAILGVPQDADRQTIKQAYREMIGKYHPDRNPGFADQANAKTSEVNEAYATLSDSDKRRRYDFERIQQRRWNQKRYAEWEARQRAEEAATGKQRTEEEARRRAEEEAQRHVEDHYPHLKHDPQSSFHGVLKMLAKKARNNDEKGEVFEKLVETFIKVDEAQSDRFSNVWLWNDYPGKDGRADFGADLVATERDGDGRIAIQCKFYAPDRSINRNAVDPFLSAIGIREFSGGIFVSTTEWTKNAEDLLQGRDKPVERWDEDKFQNSSIDWERYDLANPEVMIRKDEVRQRADQEATRKQRAEEEFCHRAEQEARRQWITEDYYPHEDYTWQGYTTWRGSLSDLFYADTDERYIADRKWVISPKSERFRSKRLFVAIFAIWMICFAAIGFIRLISRPVAWIIVGGLATAFGALTAVIVGWFGLVLMLVGGGLVNACYPRLRADPDTFGPLVFTIAGAIAFLAGAAYVVSVALPSIAFLLIGGMGAYLGVIVGRRHGGYTTPLLLNSEDEFI